MNPILLAPILKNYIWGGTRLKTEYGFESDEERVAEAWMLSSHKDGKNIETEMPILVKLIDARDKLSVQVHPNDEYALANEGEYGKTEMWYVVDCEEDAKLVYGFNQTISREEFERRIRDNTITSVCNVVPVKKGDVFFIEAGTLHAIGKGILIAEIQQNSNTTYRVSDYGRLGADGKPRPLHIEKALDVTKTIPPERDYGDVGELTLYPFGVSRNLAKCDLFTTDLLTLSGAAGLYEKDSFISVLVLDGEANLSYPLGNMNIKKGDSVLIPANMRVILSGNAEVICTHL